MVQRPDPTTGDDHGRPTNGRIGLLWRGDPAAEPMDLRATRLNLIFAALAAFNIEAEPVIYSDEVVDSVRDRLLALDGVLVWVDPISNGKDRSQLDPMLREVAARGVWVSAHPDVILKMGAKEVLHRTRALGWGADTHLYRSIEEFHEQFPPRLAASGPRVLKQNRGNGGQGVWKVELTAPSATLGPDTPVHALHAQRGSVPENLSLGDFLARCDAYFDGEGRIIDQAFQPRLPEGMIRCYMAQGEVAGFGHQLIKALIPPPVSEGPEAAQPGPRIMHPPDAPAFAALRRMMEAEWTPAMQRVLDIDTASLPALWDADFLYGPRTADGEDTYVLCEINVSAVSPYPDSAAPRVAQVALRRLRAAIEAR